MDDTAKDDLGPPPEMKWIAHVDDWIAQRTMMNLVRLSSSIKLQTPLLRRHVLCERALPVAQQHAQRSRTCIAIHHHKCLISSAPASSQVPPWHVRQRYIDGFSSSESLCVGSTNRPHTG